MLEKQKVWMGSRIKIHDEMALASQKAKAQTREALGIPTPWWQHRLIKIGGLMFSGAVVLGTCSALQENGGAEKLQEATGQAVGEATGGVRSGVGIAANAASQAAEGILPDCIRVGGLSAGEEAACAGNGQSSNSNNSGGGQPVITVGPSSGNQAPSSGNGNTLTVQPNWGVTNVLRACGITFSYTALEGPWQPVAALNADVVNASSADPGLDPGEQIVCPS